MYGKITDIMELHDEQVGRSQMSGYKITTDQTEISVLIRSAQSCCEDWGYISSEDDHSGFIGAELRGVNLADTALDQKKLKKFYPSNDGYEFLGGGVQFVDFATDKGIFQLAVYNSHNGYYGHDILVRIGGETIHEATL